MKTLAIILLGLAGVLPSTCSKNKSECESKTCAPVQKGDSGAIRKDVVLYGPAIITVKATQKNA